MRINKFIALATGMSRRAADAAIREGRVTLGGQVARVGQEVEDGELVAIDNRPISTTANTLTIMLNKPTGYVVSRDGQGSPTIYELLPKKYHSLKPIGRLDKDSSGLLLLTNDGKLANKLTHPSFQKEKTYEVELNKELQPPNREQIEQGIALEDGVSKLRLEGHDKNWTVKMSEGRNRQIRRTFAALGYKVTRLHRTQFGHYQLDNLEVGKIKEIL